MPNKARQLAPADTQTTTDHNGSSRPIRAPKIGKLSDRRDSRIVADRAISDGLPLRRLVNLKEK
jgi:hypothetical protein